MFYVLLIGSVLFSGVNFCECDPIIENDDNDGPDLCEILLESFAYETGNFTYCTIYYARPIKLCEKCSNRYMKVRTVYSDINDYNATGGEFCKDKLFNLDRLQVVDSGFKYVTSLWKRAYCDSCYNLNDKKEPSTLKTGVELMLNISKEFESCVKNHTNVSLPHYYDANVCQDCHSFYKLINRQYSVLKGSSGEDDICMDIVDLVNQTRIEWSTTLGCYVDRKKPELIYLIITAFAAVIPIIFYFFTWCLITKKQQLVAFQNNVPDYLKQIHRRASNAIINR